MPSPQFRARSHSFLYKIRSLPSSPVLTCAKTSMLHLIFSCAWQVMRNLPPPDHLYSSSYPRCFNTPRFEPRPVCQRLQLMSRMEQHDRTNEQIVIRTARRDKPMRCFAREKPFPAIGSKTMDERVFRTGSARPPCKRWSSSSRITVVTMGSRQSAVFCRLSGQLSMITWPSALSLRACQTVQSMTRNSSLRLRSECLWCP